MPPKKSTTTSSDAADTVTTSGGTNLTTRDLEILTIAMQCNKADLAIDYAKMAELGGFKTTASARTGWHNIRKKLGIELSSAGGKGEGAEGAKTPVKGGNKRKKADVEEGSEDGEIVPVAKKAAPTKKAAAGKKGKAVKEEEDAAEGGSQGSAEMDLETGDSD